MPMERILRRLTSLPGARSLWCRFPVGPLKLRVHFGISSRPHYAFGIYSAADLAAKLNIPVISVIEFGVAGGRGLLAMEHIAAEVSRTLGVGIEVYGFDIGSGMPTPLDFRDLPHVWDKGFYAMDQGALEALLKQAKLIVGDVAKTVPEFARTHLTAPVGFVAFDLDYYSSTKAALQIFDGGPESHLPRVFCYFDDVIWPESACHNEYMGELCALREFNEEHARMKVTPIHMFAYTRPHPAAWNEQTYVLHDYQHPLYCVNLTPKEERYTQLPI